MRVRKASCVFVCWRAKKGILRHSAYMSSRATVVFLSGVHSGDGSPRSRSMGAGVAAGGYVGVDILD